jgi:hypothetical protein
MTSRPVTMSKWIVLAALAVSCLPVSAQNSAGATLDRATKILHQKFVNADADKDGYLTQQEAEKGNMPGIAKHFADIDTARSGKISEDQIRRFVAQRAADRAKSPHP